MPSTNWRELLGRIREIPTSEHGDSLTFPHLVEIDDCGCHLQFEDGTKILVPPGLKTFRKRPVEVRISKFRFSKIGEPVTDALGFSPSIDLGNEQMLVVLPVMAKTDKGAGIVLYDNPRYPDEDDCMPRPAGARLVEPGVVQIATTRMFTMQIVRDDRS
jgi:hypothetical protein